MDRSFLLRKEVIEASRDFICIRLATYEDKDEAAYLVKVFPGRTGALENTVYTMLSPDAKAYLTRSGRSPGFAFQDSAAMATQMHTFAAKYKPNTVAQVLPTAKDFRVALNVAACDNMPLVVGVVDSFTEKSDDQASLRQRLADLAWSKELRGVYAYAPISTVKQLRDAKINVTPGVYVISPDIYGQTGKVLERVDVAADTAEIRSKLTAALTRFKPPAKEAQTHIWQGNQSGIFWQTAIPITDPNDPSSRRQR